MFFELLMPNCYQRTLFCITRNKPFLVTCLGGKIIKQKNGTVPIHCSFLWNWKQYHAFPSHENIPAIPIVRYACHAKWLMWSSDPRCVTIGNENQVQFALSTHNKYTSNLKHIYCVWYLKEQSITIFLNENYWMIKHF